MEKPSNYIEQYGNDAGGTTIIKDLSDRQVVETYRYVFEQLRIFKRLYDKGYEYSSGSGAKKEKKVIKVDKPSLENIINEYDAIAMSLKYEAKLRKLKVSIVNEKREETTAQDDEQDN